MDGEGPAIGCNIDLGYYINKEALGKDWFWGQILE